MSKLARAARNELAFYHSGFVVVRIETSTPLPLGSFGFVQRLKNDRLLDETAFNFDRYPKLLPLRLVLVSPCAPCWILWAFGCFAKPGGDCF